MIVHEEKFEAGKCCKMAANALDALGMHDKVDAGCNACPFPFCVQCEARAVKRRARALLEQQASILRGGVRLRMRLLASELGITTRTLRRRTKAASECHWCAVDNISREAFCRSSTCTVALDEGKIVVALSQHRHASVNEFKLVETLVGSLFPDGVLKNGDESVHSHWEIGRVSEEEKSRVYSQMEMLSKFAPTLR